MTNKHQHHEEWLLALPLHDQFGAVRTCCSESRPTLGFVKGSEIHTHLEEVLEDDGRHCRRIHLTHFGDQDRPVDAAEEAGDVGVDAAPFGPQPHEPQRRPKMLHV